MSELPEGVRVFRHERYDDWEAAYDACREADAPLIVHVAGETVKIFPSGGYKPISPDPLDAAIDATDGAHIDLVGPTEA